MALSTREAMKDIGLMVIDFSDAMGEDSDGGATITVKEITSILSNRGITLINDALDKDDVPQGNESE